MAMQGLRHEDIERIKDWTSDYSASQSACGRWILPPSRFVIQNDDHDQQHPGSSSRWMGDKGTVLIKDKDIGKHRYFETQLFDRKDADWKIKVVLSSYTFFENGANGFPDGKSDCAGFDSSKGQKCEKSVPYDKAFRKGSCGYTVEGFQGGKYTRVHRDLSIVNAMRKWIGGLPEVNAKDLGMESSCV